MAHCQPSHKISSKSVHKFLCKVANKQTNNDKNITSLVEVITEQSQQRVVLYCTCTKSTVTVTHTQVCSTHGQAQYNALFITEQH